MVEGLIYRLRRLLALSGLAPPGTRRRIAMYRTDLGLLPRPGLLVGERENLPTLVVIAKLELPGAVPSLLDVNADGLGTRLSLDVECRAGLQMLYCRSFQAGRRGSQP